ncbi:DUF2170 family protein [Fulvimarina endophytica]|uniref:DUF2170 family protein n=1 Tax=Fulvimarina endophytica TaxID=2293836 RepID=A0A371XBF3_9HYPH|nr:DUF2170 family protein [Fulvimarina endophytica]
MEPWNLASLTELFASDPDELGDVDVSVVEETDVLRVTLREKGDLDVLITASGDQVLASVILVKASEVPRRAEFDRMILSTHKLVPLSTFGIVTIDGEEWYELFGALSALSSEHAMLEEIAVLAENAVDAADMIHDWRNGEFGQ